MRSSGMRDTGVMLLGAGVGAGLMFLLDPKGGNRRRSLVRDKIFSLGRDAVDSASRRSQDVLNRARGEMLEWWQGVRERRVDDDTLEQRARAQVGHVVSHPGALEFHARDGMIIITGPVLRGEKMKIQERLHKTRGVRSADLSGIQEHTVGDRIPGLQGRSRGQRRFGT
jgi:hypothetical protein